MEFDWTKPPTENSGNGKREMIFTIIWYLSNRLLAKNSYYKTYLADTAA